MFSRTMIQPGRAPKLAAAAIAAMVALWLAATLVLGKGWCGYGCFFGGFEEGSAAPAWMPAFAPRLPDCGQPPRAAQIAVTARGPLCASRLDSRG